MILDIKKLEFAMKERVEEPIADPVSETPAEAVPTFEDTVKGFVDSECEVAPSHVEKSSILYDAFVSHSGLDVSRKKFTRALKSMGFDNNKNKPVYFSDVAASCRAFKGLKLKVHSVP